MRRGRRNKDPLTIPFRKEFEIWILHRIRLVQHIDIQGIFLLVSPTSYYTCLMYLGN
jgi:hypothetical protein